MAEKRHSDRRSGNRKRKPREKSFKSRILVDVSYGELTPDDLSRTTPVVLHSSMVTRSELKVHEATYFFAMLRKHLHNETAVLYHLDALLTSLRAITFVLHKEGSRRADFIEWYSRKREEMKARGMRTLVDLRNVAEKEGLEAPSVEFVFEHRAFKDGHSTQAVLFESFSIAGTKIASPIPYLESALTYLRELVSEAKHLGLISKPQVDRAVQARLRVLREQSDGSWISEPPPKSWSLQLTGIE